MKTRHNKFKILYNHIIVYHNIIIYSIGVRSDTYRAVFRTFDNNTVILIIPYFKLSPQ